MIARTAALVDTVLPILGRHFQLIVIFDQMVRELVVFDE
jgi:hypothetical protein